MLGYTDVQCVGLTENSIQNLLFKTKYHYTLTKSKEPWQSNVVDVISIVSIQKYYCA